MKKLLLPLLLVLLVLPAYAQASVLTFATQNGEPFQMLLNGRLVNQRASNFVRVANLRPGTHTVEFKVMSRRGVHVMGTRVAAVNGFETNYAIRPVGRSGKVQLRRLSAIPLHPPVVVVPVPQPQQPRYPDYDRYDPNRPAPGYEQPRPDAGYNRNDNCRNLLTSYDIDRLTEQMRGRNMESTKLTIAREAVRSGSILAEDLKNVLLEFGFESTRVEFAKFAYDYVCDQERFYYVYDAFQFDGNVRELEEYTSRRR